VAGGMLPCFQAHEILQEAASGCVRGTRFIALWPPPPFFCPGFLGGKKKPGSCMNGGFVAGELGRGRNA